MNRTAETKKCAKTAKYEVLTVTSSKVMSKKRYFYKGVFLYKKKHHLQGTGTLSLKGFGQSNSLDEAPKIGSYIHKIVLIGRTKQHPSKN